MILLSLKPDKHYSSEEGNSGELHDLLHDYRDGTSKEVSFSQVLTLKAASENTIQIDFC